MTDHSAFAVLAIYWINNLCASELKKDERFPRTRGLSEMSVRKLRQEGIRGVRVTRVGHGEATSVPNASGSDRTNVARSLNSVARSHADE